MWRRVQLVHTTTLLYLRYGELHFESAITHSGYLHVRTWAPMHTPLGDVHVHSCKLHEKYYAINFIARFVFFFCCARHLRKRAALAAAWRRSRIWRCVRLMLELVVVRATICIVYFAFVVVVVDVNAKHVCGSSIVVIVVVVTMFSSSLTILVRWYFNHASVELQILFVIWRSMVQ